MKTKTYLTKDNEEKQEYRLEAGDEVISLWSKPNAQTFKNGENEITKYSIFVTYNNNDIYLTLTKGQYTRLNNESEKESLEGKKLRGNTYKNTFGEHVGVDVLKA